MLRQVPGIHIVMLLLAAPAMSFAATSTIPVDSNGNIGFNSTAPTAQLNVKNNGTNLFQITNSTAGDYMVVTSAGNVGIGVTNPNTPFLVASSASGQQTLLKITNLHGSGSDAANIDFQITGGVTNGSIARIGAVRTNLGIDGAGDITLSNYGSAGFTEKLRIVSTGNVGVNSTAPTAQLNVKNNAFVPFQITNAAAGDYLTVTSAGCVGIGAVSPVYKLQVAGTIYANAGEIYLDTARNLYWGNSRQGISAVNDGNISFRTGNTADRLVINSTGNVGIGTTVPASKLDVVGGAARILSGTSSPSVGYATSAGSLYIQNDLEIDGSVYLGDTLTSAISSDVGFNINTVARPSAPTLSLITADGNLGVGTYRYTISVVTEKGESDSPNTSAVTTEAGKQQVNVSWTASTDPRATGYKLYRTAVGGNDWETKFLVSVSGASTTSYVDNISDASLTGNASAGTYHINSTSDYITVGGVRAAVLDRKVTIFGVGSGLSLSTGGETTIIGHNSAYNTTTGTEGTYVGAANLPNLTTGGLNQVFGFNNLPRITGSGSNVVVGHRILYNASTASQNTMMGIGTFNGSGGTSLTQSYNTAVGYQAGYNAKNERNSNALFGFRSGYNLDGSNNAFFGAYSGYYETAGNTILIDTLDRGSETQSREKALIYGMVNSNATIQKLILGGGGNVGIGSTVPRQKLDVNGIVNASGYYVDDAPFTASQWTTTSSDIYYNDGNVGIGTTNTLNFKALVSQNLQVGKAFSYTPSVGDLAVGSASANSRILIGQSATYYGALKWNYNSNGALSTLSLGVSTSNVIEGVNIIRGGNVGVNSTSPTAQLNVKNNGTNPFQITNAEAGDYVVVTSSGNMGIGTLVPNSKLYILGTSPTSSALSVQGANSQTQYLIDWFNSGGTRLGAVAASGELRMSSYYAGSPSYSFIADTDTGMYGLSANVLGFATGGSARVVIDATGNLGVGTTVPAAKFEIVGAAEVPSAGATPNGLFRFSAGTASIFTAGFYNAGASPYAWFQPRHLTAAGFYNLILNPVGGNVGIGTTVPQQKLEVIGTVKATAFSGDGAGITGIGGTVAWNNVTGTSQTMAVNNGYIANNASAVTMTMPASAAVGSVVSVAGGGAGGWIIQLNGGQTIHFGSVDTSDGGTLASTNRYDAVQLLCVTADTDFVVISAQGNITYN